MKKVACALIVFVSLACILGGTAQAQILIDQWGKTAQGKAWPIKNDASTLAGDASIGNGARQTGWSTIRGGFDPVTITTDSAIIVSGKLEFVGGGGVSAYTWMRYALTFLDSTTLLYSGTDSAYWDSPKKHYGYEFCPRSGTGTMGSYPPASSVWTVVNGSWSSNWSNGGKGVLATVKQSPRNAVAIAGLYNWAISVKSINDTLNEVHWYLIEQNNKYWWGGSFIDTATSKKFNGVCFGFNNDVEATQVNFYQVKVDMGAPIIVPEPPFQLFYVDQWGRTMQGTNRPILNDSSTAIGNASLGTPQPQNAWATIRGGFSEPVSIEANGKAIILSGKLEYVGGSYLGVIPLRYALTFQDSAILQYQYTDSAMWVSQKGHYGYEFVPGPQSFSSDLHTVFTIYDNIHWNSTYSNHGISIETQVPRYAKIIEGVYNWAISIEAKSNGTNEVRWYLIDVNNKYWWGGIAVDSTQVNTKFNGICFGFADGVNTDLRQFNLIDVKVEKGVPIIVPEPPFQPFYVDQWGVIGNKFGGWKFLPDSNGLTGNAGIGGNTPNTNWAAIRGAIEPFTPTNGMGLKVTGTIMLIGGGFEAANSLRIGLLNGNAGNLVIDTSPVDGDSTHWSGSDTVHTGILFVPRSGTASNPIWGNSVQGSVGAIAGGVWFLPAGNASNRATGNFSQQPVGAIADSGTYNFALSVVLQEDEFSDVSFRLEKTGYHYAANIIEDNPAIISSFNGIAFALDTGNTITSLRVIDVYFDTTSTPINVGTLNIARSKEQFIPTVHALYQNYPNPFNPTTTIKYMLPNVGARFIVSLKVYDLLGREVAILFEGIQQSGIYDAIFEGSKLSSGVYFYQLKAGNFVSTKKLILLK